MKKIKIEYILKPGYTINDLGGKIDPNDPEFKKSIAESKKRQKEALRRKNIDWDKLMRTRITI